MTTDEVISEIEDRLPKVDLNEHGYAGLHTLLERYKDAAVKVERERCATVVRKAVAYHYGYSGEVIASEVLTGAKDVEQDQATATRREVPEGTGGETQDS